MRPKNQVKLSELVMLQMVGGLEQFIDLALKGWYTDHVIDGARELATTPELFSNMVENTISTQFGNSMTALRELGQNARDAYSLYSVNRRIEFNVHEGKEGNRIIARDYGCGMTPEEVFTLFLVPYNSGKEFDSEKIGEHGIGFYSILDLCKSAHITTRNLSGKKTMIDIVPCDGDWEVSYSFSDDWFHGTKVEMEVDKFWVSKERVERTLREELGFLSDTYSLTCNGEQLNDLAQEYAPMARKDVLIGNRPAAAQLAVRQPDIAEIEESGDRRPQGSLVMTQVGLHVKDPNSYELVSDEVLKELVDRLRDVGYGFWLELPNGIRLTKGRNNIVSEDAKLVKNASETMFAKGVLEMLLDDEVNYALDNSLADIIDHLLEGQIIKKKVRVRDVVLDAILEMYKMFRYTEIKMAFQNFKLVMSMFQSAEAAQKVDEAKAKLKYGNAYDYSKLTGFAGELINERFIPAAYGKKDMERLCRTKLSVKDIVDLYLDKKLNIYPQGFDLIKALEHRDFRPGKDVTAYVDERSNVISKLLHKLEMKHPEAGGGSSFSLDLRSIFRAFPRSIDGLKHTFKSIYSSLKHKFRRSPDFNPVPLSKLERMVKKKGVGQEYVTLLENVQYIDGLVSEANSMKPANVRLFGKTPLLSSTTAYTTNQVMAINAYDHTVFTYIDDIRTGRYTESRLMSLIELVVHEKAHDLLGVYNTSGQHAKEFYCNAKKTLRDNLYRHCREKGIDPLTDINSSMEPVNTESIGHREFKRYL
ncbi:MAG: ATP-binding protein [Candidatus Woesearchaeota archaeon]